MDDKDVLNYVKASALLLALPLPEDRAQRVAGHLVRTAGMAAQLEAFDLGVAAETAEIYCPAPFNPASTGRS